MYKAILFAPDGEWVTDFRRDTKEEVRNDLANKGSRWFFYPFEAIVLCKGNLNFTNQRILEIPVPLEFLTGLSIKTVSNYIKANGENLVALLG